MTRKHFNAIADALRFSRPDFSTVAHEQWEKDCSAMADACRSFNGQFDRGRFLRACGVEAE